eukprot:TRINITY_DN92090_c0_g1_i1.p1 TRINITY_DN92090_c0_g1~~TRINITY_DN92090_c0_g1_i1.p1  ORF type:complete len:533 (-),score=72.03 TRINITY_DN92090_c0_g1_i1:225-1613(-)
MPAAASTTLFVLCELWGATADRLSQLLGAAMLLAVLAALHTHTILGSDLCGWKVIQPFAGGKTFMLLQTLGWALFAMVLFVGACMLAGALCMHCDFYGLKSVLGVLQLLAQLLLVHSLNQFDSSSVSTQTRLGSRRVQAKVEEWRTIGMSFPLAGCLVSLGVGATVFTFTTLTGSLQYGIGWSIWGLLGVAQAFGIHTMWTLTWLLMTAGAYCLESEFMLATMACCGFANVNAPWYILRFLWRKFDYPHRAMLGQVTYYADHWLSMKGFYPYDVAPNMVFYAFNFIEASLHIWPGLALMQYSARHITPACILLSFAITLTWFGTVSLKHRVMDLEAVREGRLLLVDFGGSSFYEPSKVGQIYAFQNDLIPDSDIFLEHCPGMISIFIAANIFLLAVAASSASAGDVYFQLGGGALLSIVGFLSVAAVCFVVAVAIMLTAFGMTVLEQQRHLRATAMAEKKVE